MEKVVGVMGSVLRVVCQRAASCAYSEDASLICFKSKSGILDALFIGEITALKAGGCKLVVEPFDEIVFDDDEFLPTVYASVDRINREAARGASRLVCDPERRTLSVVSRLPDGEPPERMILEWLEDAYFLLVRSVCATVGESAKSTRN